jgi:DNA polymerase III subunit delta
VAGPAHRSGLDEPPKSCYFLYGEEPYFADEFLADLKDSLSGELFLETFDLAECGWPAVLDAARTVPFLFSPWRVVIARLPEPDERDGRGEGNGEAKRERLLTEPDKKAIRAFTADPPPRTILVVVFPGTVKTGAAVVRFFESLPPSSCGRREGKRLKDERLVAWIVEKAAAAGKRLAGPAAARLAAAVGSDLRRLSTELEKLAVAAGERREIEAADVDRLTAWTRDFENYELTNGLEEGDLAKTLRVLSTVLQEGTRPEQVLGQLVRYFHNLLWAKACLRDKTRSPREIFAAVAPGIKETMGAFYSRKSGAFFGLVERLSTADLKRILDDLARVDGLLKTSDVPVQTALESFLYFYDRLAPAERVTSRPGRPAGRAGG